MPRHRGDPSPSAPIAVIGMALRVPGATTVERYWRNLAEGRDCITRPSVDALRRAGIGLEQIRDPDYVLARPILDDVEGFDAGFFGMSGPEAEVTDPSQRLFLECAWECLESAAIVPGRPGPVVGVFGGCEGNYLTSVLGREGAPASAGGDLAKRLGNSLDFLTTRVSHKLDLTGPSFGVLAACATSLLAVDLAAHSLRRGECDVALAGGATIDLPRLRGYSAGVEGMLSPTGTLRPFDAAADGTIFGSGVGVVALRPLADAIAAGNPIHAVILGAAAGNDGNPPGKESFIAPSPEGQMAAIEAALRDAGISPATIGYVEAHGTGTRLGDPVEVAALTEVYRRYTDRSRYCAIGSVKANVGHLRCGAGVASLIKACLALRHATLPPLANFRSPNPAIDFDAGPFYVNREAQPWAEGPTPRRAAVSSFGFGGSNTHVVLEEYRRPPAPPCTSRRRLLVVSARSEAALGRQVGALGAHLEAHPALPAADLAHTLQQGRRAFAHRACFLADGDRVAPEQVDLRRALARGIAPAGAATPVFLFPGQGAQRYGAGRGLYVREARYRDIVDECAVRLAPSLDLDLRTLLGYAGPTEDAARARAVLRRTAHAQPALFVVGYATARLLMSWGVTPAAMLGHSLGELVAACLAGVFSLADGLALVAARARLMQACAPGAMAAVLLPEAVLAPRLPPDVEIAAVNTPGIAVVSGPGEAVARLCAELEREGIGTQPIETSHAFHSRMMEPALPEFERVAAGIALSAPRIPVISNATGLPLTPEQATDPHYWAAHVRNPVRFSAGAQTLLALDQPVFVEAGPGATLSELVRRHAPAARVFPALAAADGDDASTARAALGALWCAGVDVDWDADGDGRRTLLALPTYPFERMRHWRDVAPVRQDDPAKVLYERGFRAEPLPAAAGAGPAGPWLVIGDGLGLGSALHERLAAAGATVATLAAGRRFARTDAHGFSGQLDSRDDLRAVLGATMAGGGEAPRILHLGSVTGTAGRHNTAEAFEDAATAGFFSLVALTQAAFDLGIGDRLQVLVVADGLARLDGEPGVRYAEKAAVLGATRQIPLEIPGLRLRVVDIPSWPAGGVPEWLPEALLREASAAGAPPLVCVRATGRFVEQLFALPALPQSTPRLRENGAVLITGGTGGLGLLFAGALFDLARARLALTARWEPPPEAEWPQRAAHDDRIGRSLAGILALRARGAEVIVLTADVADRAQLARALDTMRERFGGVHGVIHAAGAVQPTPVVEKTRASAAGVFGPKVHGAFHLEQLVGDLPLDFFVQISSQASQFPGAGQVDYAAANAVLDVLAQNRAERQPGLSCATGWGPWQGFGIAVDRLRRSLGEAVANAGPGEPLRDDGDGDGDRLDHPILRWRRCHPDGTRTYRGQLRPGHWVVDDHRFDGRPLLSGTTIVQLVRTAFADHAPKPGAILLSRVAFERPLFTDPGGTEIELVFAAGRDDEAFTLRSRPAGSDQPWCAHTTGYARRIATAPRPVPSPPPASAWEGAEARSSFGGKAISGGPRWRVGSRAIEQQGRHWRRVALAAEHAPDLTVFDLHPGLFDGALRDAAQRTPGERVPHTYDDIRIFGALTPEVVCVTELRRAGREVAADVTITDPDGRVLVEIDGYVMRPIEGSALVRVIGERAALPAPTHRRIVVSEPGNLDTMRVEAFAPRPPARGEVEIEVHATGLNFRDVLTALGQMPAGGDGPIALGGECSGVVLAVGPGVRHVAPGDAVVAIARGALGTRTTTAAHGVAVKPGDIDFNRAAGLPIVFLTAQYALETLARVQAGERVLIHAAAGGVGLAAIQIARRLGAEIHATAGHPDKRAYLRSLGVVHVYDSRSLAFVDEVRAATGGEGVDVVLNSLAGEFIPAGLGLLRPQGRFVEIGKRDLLADTPVGLAPFLRNLTFTAFDLGQLVDLGAPRFPSMLDGLMDRFACGELQPLPTETFALDRAADGFRRMARAEHVGKIVFEVQADATPAGAVARAFEQVYGTGVTVDWGLDVFRRLLTASEVPPYVLAMGTALDGAGAGAAEARPRTAAGARGGRDNVAATYRAPQTAVEKALVALWERILGIAPIGVDDPFFDLGGDSIEAIQIQHAIHRDFELRVKITDFLAAPTIAALAARIERRDGGIRSDGR